MLWTPQRSGVLRRVRAGMLAVPSRCIFIFHSALSIGSQTTPPRQASPWSVRPRLTRSPIAREMPPKWRASVTAVTVPVMTAL
jgi:hypothetical protein